MEVGALKVEVVRKDIKNIHLSVYPPNGSVRLASPREVKDETIRLFVVSKIGWIRRQQRRFQKQEREGVKEYLQRESHYFLGKRYLLKIIEKDHAPAISVSSRVLTMAVRPGTTVEKRQQILEQWYRGQLREVLAPLVEKWKKKIHVDIDSWTIRKMRTKWGTCNTDSKRISFNLELAKKPVECIEFIVVHELVHLLERRHSPRFQSLVEKYLPDWKKRKRYLNSVEIGALPDR